MLVLVLVPLTFWTAKIRVLLLADPPPPPMSRACYWDLPYRPLRPTAVPVLVAEHAMTMASSCRLFWRRILWDDGTTVCGTNVTVPIILGMRSNKVT